MYRTVDGIVRREGHDSIGTTSPADSYYLAEGTSAWGFTTYLLVQNPNGAATDVNVTYMTDAGPVPHPENPINMPANSRKTIRVNDYLPDKDFSTLVEGEAPIIAERAMYWDNGTGEACHDSIGLDRAHTSFYLPDGQADDLTADSTGHETWTLVQNPNTEEVEVEVTYFLGGGGTPTTFTDTIPGSSRHTYDMGGRNGFPAYLGRASVMVRCLTAGKKIMCERAMYWNQRGAGTDTIGGYSD
jgi:hypothetical protein